MLGGDHNFAVESFFWDGMMEEDMVRWRKGTTRRERRTLTVDVTGREPGRGLAGRSTGLNVNSDDGDDAAAAEGVVIKAVEAVVAE